MPVRGLFVSGVGWAWSTRKSTLRVGRPFGAIVRVVRVRQSDEAHPLPPVLAGLVVVSQPVSQSPLGFDLGQHAGGVVACDVVGVVETFRARVGVQSGRGGSD